MATSWDIIEKWVNVTSEHGQELQFAPDPRFALFDPDDHPDFNPEFWNGQQRKANCMGYALEAVGESLLPGYIRPYHMCENRQIADEFNRVGYRMQQAIAPDEFEEIVRMGVLVDGLKKVQSADELYKPDHYLVALNFHHAASSFDGAIDNDFHFVRLDKNGRWSMTCYGNYEGVSFHDRDMDKILNPARTNWGSFMKFDGFYHVPKGGIETLRPRLRAG